MADQWTPERPDSPWKTRSPWVFLKEEGRTCQYHGDYVAKLVQGHRPANYDRDVAKLSPKQREALAPFIRDWWTKCEKCDDQVHREQVGLYEEVWNGMEMRKLLRKQQAALAGVPPRYAETHIFDNYKLPLPSADPKVAQVRNWANALDINMQSGRSLLITGTVGTGKTHIVSAVANFCIGKGLSVRFTTEEDMYAAVKATFDKGDGPSSNAVTQAFADCDILVIDELGRYTQTDFDQKVLGSTINARYERCRPTILTSNRRKSELKTLVGAAVWSRLAGNMQTVAFTWQDLRSEYDERQGDCDG